MVGGGGGEASSTKLVLSNLALCWFTLMRCLRLEDRCWHLSHQLKAWELDERIWSDLSSYQSGYIKLLLSHQSHQPDVHASTATDLILYSQVFVSLLQVLHWVKEGFGDSSETDSTTSLGSETITNPAFLGWRAIMRALETLATMKVCSFYICTIQAFCLSSYCCSFRTFPICHFIFVPDIVDVNVSFSLITSM